MELSNEFTVAVSVDEAWSVLTDVARIAPCMPGAQLQEVEGDEYRGVVKVKVGPVTAEYKGKATFVERDPVAHRAVLRAEGRETRGQGNASATITANLEPVGASTRVSVTTDLSITGRVAQFGRGVLADVSNKLLGQFVSSLESTVLAGSAPSPAGGGGSGETGAPQAGSTDGSGAAVPAGRRSSAAKKSASGTKRAPAPEAGAGEGGTSSEATGRGAGEAADRGTGEAAGEAADRGAGEGASDTDRAAVAGMPASASPDGDRGVIAGPEPEAVPVDLLRVAGPGILKRVVPPLAALAGLWFLWRRRRHRRALRD